MFYVHVNESSILNAETHSICVKSPFFAFMIYVIRRSVISMLRSAPLSPAGLDREEVAKRCRRRSTCNSLESRTARRRPIDSQIEVRPQQDHQDARIHRTIRLADAVRNIP